MARRTAMAAVALAAMAASPIPEVKAAAAETSPAASGPPPEASISSATELEATSTPDVDALRAEIEALTRQLGVDQQRNTELSEMLEAQAKDHRAEIEHLRIELLAHRNDAWAKREAELEAEVKGYRVEVERLRAEALAQRDDFNDAWAKREAEIKARFDVMRESAAPLIVREQLPVLPEGSLHVVIARAASSRWSSTASASSSPTGKRFLSASTSRRCRRAAMR